MPGRYSPSFKLLHSCFQTFKTSRNDALDYYMKLTGLTRRNAGIITASLWAYKQGMGLRESGRKFVPSKPAKKLSWNQMRIMFKVIESIHRCPQNPVRLTYVSNHISRNITTSAEIRELWNMMIAEGYLDDSTWRIVDDKVLKTESLLNLIRIKKNFCALCELTVSDKLCEKCANRKSML
jgi:hypothetical protein